MATWQVLLTGRLLQKPAQEFCRISEYLYCGATLFASDVIGLEAPASLQACRTCARRRYAHARHDELDCRNRKFARMATADTGPNTHQRPCGATGLAPVRDSGKATVFTVRAVIRGSWSIFLR